MVFQAAWFFNEELHDFSIVGVQVGSAWYLLCSWGAPGRKRPTKPAVRGVQAPGVRGPGTSTHGFWGGGHPIPLAPGLAAPAAPTACCQAPRGAEPIITVPSGFCCLSWFVLPVLSCPGWALSPPEDCGKSRVSGASHQGVLPQRGSWPKKQPLSSPQPGGNPCVPGLIVLSGCSVS